MDISHLSEQDIQELMELGVIPNKMKDLDKQQSLAEALRYQGMPEGRSTGRIYTAANPLETIGTFMQARKAGKQLDAMPGQREALYAQQLAGRKRFLDLLRGGGGGAGPTAPINPTRSGY